MASSSRPGGTGFEAVAEGGRDRWFLRERPDLGGKDPDLYLAHMCGRMFHGDHPATSRDAGLVIKNLLKFADIQAREGKIPALAPYPV